MYYSSGNYEAFARPRKPDGVERKRAWFVGAGLSSLSSAVLMIRDGQMPGENITILERLKLPGGALDGIKRPEKGFVVRGGREMENHYDACGTAFGRSRHSRSTAHRCWMSSTGSTRTTRTSVCSG